MKDVEDIDYPVLKASEETERAARQSLKELDYEVDATTFFETLHDES